MHDILALTLYATPLAMILAFYVRAERRRLRAALVTLEDNRSAGLLEPASLHPAIDTAKCIGCGACAAACPEMPGHQVLGLLRGKAALISPTDCIGHGACRAACPVDAITLVFGTATRGVDIPLVRPNFESNVDGIFIAGELGGMGLIRNAIEQGRQAMQAIAERVGGRHGSGADVVIVGAGPTGIAAALAAKERGLRYLIIEQDSLGGTVASFPRRKLVMTAPARLPLVGNVKFAETTKEQLLDFWRGIERTHKLAIRYGERVENVVRTAGGFDVLTTKATHPARTVLLAIGRRGTPRKLDVPGEDLPKVTYRLLDPEQYRGQRVLVVGGGDSALESALAIGEQPGAIVTLSYRSAAFTRAKKSNRAKISAAGRDERVRVLLESKVVAIHSDHVELDHAGTSIRIPNDTVIVNAGGILPTAFLRQLGIEVATKYGTA